MAAPAAPANPSTTQQQMSPTPAQPAPELPPDQGYAPGVPPAPDAPGPATMNVPADGGMISIWVPNEAKVFINGRETKSTGSHRQYVSHGLKPGLTYRYEVRATMERDGRLVEATKQVYLTAGDSQRVALDLRTRPAEQLASSR